MFIAGDIGGTHARLAAFDKKTAPSEPMGQKTYPTANVKGMEEIFNDFLALPGWESRPVEAVVLSVAGPVSGGVAKFTNLGWDVDREKLKAYLNTSRVKVINDLEAWAFALPFLGADDLHVLNTGKKDERGIKACIAPGTGLGEAFLIHHGQAFKAFPSEGGHSEFAPRTQDQVALLKHLMAEHSHVSYERVCSGPAILTLYEFHKSRKDAEEPDWLKSELASAKDPVPVIVRNADSTSRDTALCRMALDSFISILGAEAGNFALKVMATGGVYLGGGIPPRIIPRLEEGAFMQAFTEKGRMQSLARSFPVYVIKNPMAGLMGAAALMFQE